MVTSSLEFLHKQISLNKNIWYPFSRDHYEEYIFTETYPMAQNFVKTENWIVTGSYSSGTENHNVT